MPPPNPVALLAVALAFRRVRNERAADGHECREARRAVRTSCRQERNLAEFVTLRRLAAAPGPLAAPEIAPALADLDAGDVLCRLAARGFVKRERPGPVRRLCRRIVSLARHALARVTRPPACAGRPAGGRHPRSEMAPARFTITAAGRGRLQDLERELEERLAGDARAGAPVPEADSGEHREA